MARDRFVNPANGAEYVWHTSHSDEAERPVSRNIAARLTTGHNRVLHESPGEPTRMRWQGKIFHRAQLQAFWSWYRLCDTQTIYLYDFDGQGYEVQIESFAPTRVRKLSYTGKDPSMPHHYYSYEITFLVYRFIAGDEAAMGVQA
jgi:hypothetical protein